MGTISNGESAPKTLSQRRLERRMAILKKELPREKKWRKETRVVKRRVRRNRWALEHKRRAQLLTKPQPSGTVALSDLGLKGRVGAANSTASAVTYARSAYHNFKQGNYAQGGAELLSSVSSAAGLAGENEKTKVLGHVANGVSIFNDVAHVGYFAYKGRGVDAWESASNGFLTGMSLVPGPVGVAGKAGLATDYCMKVSGADEMMVRTMTSHHQGEFDRIDRKNRQAALEVSSLSEERIRALHKSDPRLLARAISGYKQAAAQKPLDTHYTEEQYDNIQRIYHALEQTY